MIWFDVGVDHFLIEPNRDLHRGLLANGTPHDYIERPGGPTWEYWQNALPHQMLFFADVLERMNTRAKNNICWRCSAL